MVSFASFRRLWNFGTGCGSSSSTVECTKLGAVEELLFVDVVRDLVSIPEGLLDNRPVWVCSSVGSWEVAVMSGVLCTS